MSRMMLSVLWLVLAGCFLVNAEGLCAPMNKRVKLTSTNLPIVWLTADGTVQRTERITARMKIIHNWGQGLNYADTVAHPGQHVDYDGWVGICYRGNSSYDYSAKKPYSFRPLNRPLEQGGSWQRASILGMPRDNTWALLAPYNDKSLMRDMLAFEISRQWMEFTPRGQFCEVIFNGVYYGVFLLTEVISKGSNRLNLGNPGEDGDELTGGYLVEVDRDDGHCYRSRYRPVASDGSVITPPRIYFQYKSPEYEDLTESQLAYIQGAIDAMEYALVSHSYRDASTGECFYIDELSFIDYQLAMELGHNVDSYRLSAKFYKRRDSVDPRFKMALWDMNFAYGNADYHEGYRTDTWVYQTINDIVPATPNANMAPCWWYKLNSDAVYQQHLKERWAQYRSSNLRIDSLMATVDSLAQLLTVAGAEQRNSRAYPVWGIYVWPNYYIARDFDDEVAFLKRWLMRRIAWMDRQLGYRPPSLGGDIDGDGELTLGDVNALVDLILSGTNDPDEVARADVNSDGEVGVADVNALMDLLAE